MKMQSAVLRLLRSRRVWCGGLCGMTALMSGTAIANLASERPLAAMTQQRISTVATTRDVTIKSAQSTQPSTHTLLRAEDLHYAGSFRAPQSQDFEFGGAPVTYNPTNNSLFVGNGYGEGARSTVLRKSIYPLCSAQRRRLPDCPLPN